MPALTLQQAFDLALRSHRAGKLVEAEAVYRQILEAQPHHFGALNSLGVIYDQTGRGELAIGQFRRAVVIDPDNAVVRFNLGKALRDRGHGVEAIEQLLLALRLQPSFGEAHNVLGLAFEDQNRLNDAIASYRDALKVSPDFIEARNNLAIALAQHGQIDEAIDEFRQVIKLQPEHAAAYSNLGNTLSQRGLLSEAIAACRRAIELKPDYADAYNNLAIAFRKDGQLEGAAEACHRALEIDPNFAEAFNNLGIILTELGRLDEAIGVFNRALEIKPGFSRAFNNLGYALKDQGDLAGSIAAFRSALNAEPTNARGRSNLIYTLYFVSGIDEEAIEDEQERWNEQIARPWKQLIVPYSKDRDPDRRLRIGYVSPQFRDHATGRYLHPLIQQHDRGDFEIVCYSDVVKGDGFTELFRQSAVEWRNTVGLTDDSLAKLILRDGVDILVDLTQHLAGNRLPTFARKPAPVQVSFAGYPESTGLEAIGYRISDRWLEGGRNSEFGIRSSECEDGKLKMEKDLATGAVVPQLDTAERVYLIDSFWCYDPCGIEVGVNGLPALENGRITFGSLNNFCKVNDLVLKLWARVLGAVKNSRLILLSGLGSHRQRTVDFLAQHGVEPERIEFVVPCPRKDYLELYHRLDIALDPFPYGGHTTSLDALWMGVPVVSLAGERAVSRAGLSILSNLGLPELVAFSEGQYVDIAIRLAGDVPRLQELRRTLRSRMEGSVLMDGRRFARQIEAAYRAMWRNWCAEKSG